MSILRRIQRIAKANFNWLLDKAEPAEAELKADIAELQQAVTDGKAAAATYGATFRKMETELAGLTKKQQEYTISAKQAIVNKDDALAKKFLSEKVRLEERITNLKPGLEQGRQTYNHLKENLDHLVDKLKQAKVKLAELSSRKLAAEAREAFAKSVSDINGTFAEGEMFDRMEKEVIHIEASADITEEINGEDLDLEARSRELQIESELEALKQSLEQQGSEV